MKWNKKKSLKSRFYGKPIFPSAKRRNRWLPLLLLLSRFYLPIFYSLLLAPHVCVKILNNWKNSQILRILIWFLIFFFFFLIFLIPSFLWNLLALQPTTYVSLIRNWFFQKNLLWNVAFELEFFSFFVCLPPLSLLCYTFFLLNIFIEFLMKELLKY